MTDTIERPSTQIEATPRSGDPWLRWAGFAGLAWAAILIVTNIVNAAIAPDPDADVAAVTAHLVDDRTAIAWITAGFVAGIPLVILFMTGVARELFDRGLRLAGWIAIFGFGAVFTMFGMTAATRLALVAAVETESVEPSAIWTMWKLHDVVFGFNAAPLAATFATIGIAAAAIGLVPSIFRFVAPVGAGLMLVGALFTLQTAEGAMGAFAAGGLGFVLWVVFVLTLSTGMIRGRP